MLQTIAHAIPWICFALIALSALGGIHTILNHLKPVLDHKLTETLARRVIAHLITQLHNGEKFEPYTLDHALQTFQHQLTDLLMMNGFTIKDYNPRILAMSILSESKMLPDLIAALELRASKDTCQDSTSTPPTSLT